MSERLAILKALNEELGMEKAPGDGVQDRNIDNDLKFSNNEKEKGFKLSGDGKTVGGSSGGVTESAISKADGTGVAKRSPHQVSGTDATGAPTNNGAEDGHGCAVDRADGSAVASSKAKKSDGKSSSGGISAKAVSKARGSGVASRDGGTDGMEKHVRENRKIIELPHDTMVEADDGTIKTLSKGTKIIIGEDGMGMGLGYDDTNNMDYDDTNSMDYQSDADYENGMSDCIDDDSIAKIVTAVVQALNGSGSYDYAMEGKEILPECLVEDVKKILGEGKPWEDDEDPHAAALGRKDDDEQDTAGPEDDEDPHAAALARKESRDNRFGRTIKERGSYCEDEEEADGIDAIGDDSTDESSPNYIAALIDDVQDDFDNLKGALGFDDDDEEYDDDDEEDVDLEGDGEEDEEKADVDNLF